jgi:predicted AlkP superfamily pyrophosphatase or phosphodiesterase
MTLRARTITIAAAVLLSASLWASSPKATRRPKLVVVISVDQLSESLAKRYEATWPGGLGQLLREGTWFEEAFHDHAFTETGPGHSVLMTGRMPGHTGIIENNWYDRKSGRKTYCVADASAQLLDQKGPAASNRLLLGDTMGDWLLAQVPGSRAFSISGKDRAAILMAGRGPTAVYWFGGAQGFTSSTTYAASLPAWLKTYNVDLQRRLRNDDWTWIPLRNYAGESRQQSLTARDGTIIPNGLFPRTIQSVGLPLDESFPNRFKASPFLDQVTLEAAEALVSSERLGRGPGVDLLTLSLSATDYVGHAFGSGSMEMQDSLQRTDRRLGAFLEKLRRRVPDLWVVLTADHGCLDVPEGLQALGVPASRIDGRAWVANLNQRLNARLQLESNPILGQSEANQLYLDYKALEAAKLDAKQVAATLKAMLGEQSEVQFAATREELLNASESLQGDPRTSSLLLRLKNSFHPDRSGDVLIAFKPMTILWKAEPYHMTAHGSPYDYDCRVPLVFWGPWKQGHRTDPARIVDLAPTLGRELGLAPSPGVDGKVLNLVTRNLQTVPASK